MEAEIEIEVTEWDTRYDPKRNQKTYSWARVDHEIVDGEDFFGLDHTERYLFVVLICQASKKNSRKFKIKRDWLQSVMGIPLEKIASSLKILTEMRHLGSHNPDQMEIKEAHNISQPRPPVATTGQSCEELSAQQVTTSTDGRTDVTDGRTDVFSSEKTFYIEVDPKDSSVLSSDEISNRISGVIKNISPQSQAEVLQ